MTLKLLDNPNAYKPAPFSRVIELRVSVMLDPVPGAWHEPKDIMEWIAAHSYVQSVELAEDVKTVEHVRYINIYPSGVSGIDCVQYHSRETADENAGDARVGCKRVVFKEGEWDD